MPIADLRSASLYYESVSHGPPLLFAHGAGGNALSWWQQTDFFSARYRCITFDHPGFRHSSWSEDADSTTAYSDVAREFLDFLEIKSAAIIAQSMGGWTGLRLAMDNPDRVEALVMAATDGGVYLPDENSDSALKLESVRKAFELHQPGSFHPAVGKRMLEIGTNSVKRFI